ncbi:MAG TPA: DUF4180 domain-containing protein [Bacteroidia bacterium]
MNIRIISINNSSIAEIISEDIILNSPEEGLELLGNTYYQGFDKLIIYQKNITAEFFDLSTGIAGEVLQKFSTYRVRLAIVGDFSNFASKSLKDFISESNKQKHINFVSTRKEAIDLLMN